MGFATEYHCGGFPCRHAFLTAVYINDCAKGWLWRACAVLADYLWEGCHSGSRVDQRRNPVRRTLQRLVCLPGAAPAEWAWRRLGLFRRETGNGQQGTGPGRPLVRSRGLPPPCLPSPFPIPLSLRLGLFRRRGQWAPEACEETEKVQERTQTCRGHNTLLHNNIRRIGCVLDCANEPTGAAPRSDSGRLLNEP